MTLTPTQTAALRYLAAQDGGWCGTDKHMRRDTAGVLQTLGLVTCHLHDSTTTVRGGHFGRGNYYTKHYITVVVRITDAGRKLASELK